MFNWCHDSYGRIVVDGLNNYYYFHWHVLFINDNYLFNYFGEGIIKIHVKNKERRYKT